VGSASDGVENPKGKLRGAGVGRSSRPWRSVPEAIMCRCRGHCGGIPATKTEAMMTQNCRVTPGAAGEQEGFRLIFSGRCAVPSHL
jgi:hypothetical protein